ncbi:MAG: nitroreductase family protein [Lachnospiraceae bacterium]|nr:nitroreductase family protein [Lachnospiraceae bacterium]
MAVEAIYHRRSIRKFQDRSVSREQIEELLNAGSAAPSAKNRQPWKYIVFGGEHKQELLQRMEAGLRREEQGITDLPGSRYGIPDAWNTLRIMRQAPVLIVVLNTNAKSPFLPVDNDARVAEICDTLSVGAAIQNILLEAQNMGLGTLWIANTCFAYRELVSYLQTDRQLVGAVAVGYPDEAPPQRPRKELTQIVEYRWQDG